MDQIHTQDRKIVSMNNEDMPKTKKIRRSDKTPAKGTTYEAIEDENPKW